MNAHAHAFEAELAEPFRWARVGLVAASIPDDANLDDDEDVLRALYAEGFSSRDVEDLLEEAIEQAREARGI